MSDKIIDVPAESDSPQALTVREAVQELDKPIAPDKPQMTAAQAKVEAIADLTKSAYARASELKLTTEESEALQAEFPDEAFKPGAAGKTELLYIEHAFLRDRLNRVFGIGQWSIIPRSRWAEDYTFTDRYGKTKEASRVYTEAMLLIRGCFVSESIGEMVYYKNNDSQNYADAVEGAKTAALRRCCKELGVGLQAWKKDWCAGWWERHNANREGAARQQPTTRIEHPRNQATTAPKPPTQQPNAIAPGNYPIVTVLTVKEVHSKPEAPRQWTAYFIKFSDGFGEFEAATFDKKIADLANELANTKENASLQTKPGKKPGTTEIVSLERANQPPPPPFRPKDEDNVPMLFDDQGQPIQETIP